MTLKIQFDKVDDVSVTVSNLKLSNTIRNLGALDSTLSIKIYKNNNCS